MDAAHSQFGTPKQWQNVLYFKRDMAPEPFEKPAQHVTKCGRAGGIVTGYEFQQAMGIENDQLLDVALALEEAALNDEYFKKRNLFPNIDYYSGLLMRMMNIPSNMFNVMFAIPRSAGWIAHWREMMSDPVIKIYRPRQIYVGQALRDFVPIEERKDAPGFGLVSTSRVQ